MKDNRIFLVLLLVFASTLCICAQEPNDSLQIKTNAKPFVTLYHQHHDFFGKAFSFQGILTIKPSDLNNLSFTFALVFQIK